MVVRRRCAPVRCGLCPARARESVFSSPSLKESPLPRQIYVRYYDLAGSALALKGPFTSRASGAPLRTHFIAITCSNHVGYD